jgi:hypothetical protein
MNLRTLHTCEVEKRATKYLGDFPLGLALLSVLCGLGLRYIANERAALPSLMSHSPRRGLPALETCKITQQLSGSGRVTNFFGQVRLSSDIVNVARAE